jgi:hypothetical protein
VRQECPPRSSGCEDRESSEGSSESIEHPRRSIELFTTDSIWPPREINSRTKPSSSRPSSRRKPRRSKPKSSKPNNRPEEKRISTREREKPTKSIDCDVLYLNIFTPTRFIYLLIHPPLTLTLSLIIILIFTFPPFRCFGTATPSFRKARAG